jgi:hypothetical protein
MAIKINKKDEFSAHLGEMKAQVVVGTVSAQHKNGKMLVDKQETVHKGVMVPAEKMCQVHVGGSHTVNLGNYESAKISVGITVPCVKEDINDTYDFATNWVSDKITEAVKDVKG